jgi:hypothetical protein
MNEGELGLLEKPDRGADSIVRTWGAAVLRPYTTVACGRSVGGGTRLWKTLDICADSIGVTRWFGDCISDRRRVTRNQAAKDGG